MARQTVTHGARNYHCDTEVRRVSGGTRVVVGLKRDGDLPDEKELTLGYRESWAPESSVAFLNAIEALPRWFNIATLPPQVRKTFVRKIVPTLISEFID